MSITSTSEAWFKPPNGARRRKGKPTQIVLHWTGTENPPLRVYENLKQSKLSVHYVISVEGLIYQFADEEHVTYHAGPANETSIGIEIICQGLWHRDLVTKRAQYNATVHGQMVTILDYYPAQGRTVLDLCSWITDRWQIPRVVADPNNLDVLPDWQQFKGVLGHCHIAKSKPDPGPRILEALQERWDES